MFAGEDVFNYSNQLIIPRGQKLTDKMITRLEFYSIPYIKIKEYEDEPYDAEITEDDCHSDVDPLEMLENLISEEEGGGEEKQPEEKKEEVKKPAAGMFSNKTKASEEYQKFVENFDKSVNEFKGSLNDIVQNGTEINTDTLLHQATDLISGASTHADFFNMLHNMRQYDDLTYAHSMNVALISNILADWLKMSKEDVELATLCGLLHDIGKLKIPEQIIKKPGKLTEDEYKVVKTHTIAGYNVLKDQDISEHIKNAALMHHEKCDGSGYPFGLKGDKIDPFAKIVAIADVYDAMTAARVYRGPLCPFQVIEIFEKEGLQKYETEYIMTFLENVVMTYMNERVKLSDGTIGTIVFINHAHLSKPMIQVNDRFLDLTTEPNLSIVKII